MHAGVEQAMEYDDEYRDQESDEDTLHDGLTRLGGDSRIVGPSLVDDLARRLNFGFVKEQFLTFGEHGKEQTLFDLFLTFDGAYPKLFHRDGLHLRVSCLAALGGGADACLQFVEIRLQRLFHAGLEGNQLGHLRLSIGVVHGPRLLILVDL